MRTTLKTDGQRKSIRKQLLALLNAQTASEAENDCYPSRTSVKRLSTKGHFGARGVNFSYSAEIVEDTSESSSEASSEESENVTFQVGRKTTSSPEHPLQRPRTASGNSTAGTKSLHRPSSSPSLASTTLNASDSSRKSYRPSSSPGSGGLRSSLPSPWKPVRPASSPGYSTKSAIADSSSGSVRKLASATRAPSERTEPPPSVLWSLPPGGSRPASRQRVAVVELDDQP